MKKVFGSALAYLLACLSPLAMGGSGQAATCGGGVPCACGDTVVSDVVLSADLNGCSGTGLVVEGGTLDCGGRQISGPGDRTMTNGVLIASNSGIQVRNCRIRNFGKGVLVDGAAGAVVEDSVIFNDMHGVWVGGGSTATVIRRNEIRDNRDEGVHLGSGSSGALVEANSFARNRNENVYLLGAVDSQVVGNLITEAKEAAIFVKNASGNTFTSNTVQDRSVVVRGDSVQNGFFDNDVLGGRFAFQAIDDGGQWRFPHGNAVSGGTVRKASTCFEFLGAYDNTVTGVVIDTCEPYSEKEAGGLQPSGNIVDVIREDPPHTGGTGGSGGGATPITASPTVCPDCRELDMGRSSLRIRGDGRDRLKIRATIRFGENVALDPSAEGVEVLLRNSHSTIFYAFIPGAALRAIHGSYRFEDRSRIRETGLSRLGLRGAGGYEFGIRLRARGDFTMADESDMEFVVAVGDDEFASSGSWLGRASLWRAR